MKITISTKHNPRCASRIYPYFGYDKEKDCYTYFTGEKHLITIESGVLALRSHFQVFESDYKPFYGDITIKTEEG